MRIPIVYIPKTRFRKFLFIEKKFKAENLIIPIGCDCHPAYTLQSLNIRVNSFPFDWLNNDPIAGLDFARENFEDNFKFFLKDLYRNERGHIVSKKYPSAEFMHEKDLIENEESVKKLHRRIDRLKKSIANNTISYLYNVTSEALNNKENTSRFYESVVKFSESSREKDTLHVYIRYDENTEENSQFCDDLILNLNGLENIVAVKYIRHLSREGIWGNSKFYPKLYKDLGLKITQMFPKIYIA